MEEDRKFIYEFIRLYRSLPALWYSKHPDYRDYSKKRKSGFILLNKYKEKYPKATIRDVMKKINNLRCCFRKCAKKYENEEGAEKPTLWYYDEMTFLLKNEQETAIYSDVEMDISEDPLNNNSVLLDVSKDNMSDDNDDNNRKEDPDANIHREFIRDVIRFYRTLPVLWDAQHPDYRDFRKKRKANFLLLNKFRERFPSATMHDVRKKINALRCSFKKCAKKYGNVDRNNKFHRQPKLWYYDEMSFILGSSKELAETDIESSYLEISLDPLNNSEHNRSPSKYDGIYDNDDSSQMEELSSFDPEHLHIKPELNTTQEDEDAPKLLYNYIEDEYEIWGKVVAADLKKMDTVQQIYAKRAIYDILMEGQLGLLNRDSVQINKNKPD